MSLSPDVSESDPNSNEFSCHEDLAQYFPPAINGVRNWRHLKAIFDAKGVEISAGDASELVLWRNMLNEPVEESMIDTLSEEDLPLIPDSSLRRIWSNLSFVNVWVDKQAEWRVLQERFVSVAAHHVVHHPSLWKGWRSVWNLDRDCEWSGAGELLIVSSADDQFHRIVPVESKVEFMQHPQVRGVLGMCWDLSTLYFAKCDPVDAELVYTTLLYVLVRERRVHPLVQESFETVAPLLVVEINGASLHAIVQMTVRVLQQQMEAFHARHNKAADRLADSPPPLEDIQEVVHEEDEEEEHENEDACISDEPATPLSASPVPLPPSQPTTPPEEQQVDEEEEDPQTQLP